MLRPVPQSPLDMEPPLPEGATTAFDWSARQSAAKFCSEQREVRATDARTAACESRSSEADDAAALTHEARQRREAEAMADLLAVERDEAALVWSAMARNLPVEHRADINPVALLGVRLVTAPRANPSPGTSPEHAFDIVGGWR